MDLKMFETAGRNLGSFLNRNSPTIFTTLGLIGLGTTTLSAIEATKRAVEVIDEEEAQRATDNFAEGHEPIAVALTPVEKAKLTWKFYIPTMISAVMTASSIITANSISMRRNAALAGMYGIAEAALKEYKDKVVETIGEKKEEKLRSEIAQDRLDKNPVEDANVTNTGRGTTLCYDSLSGRYFLSDIEFIRQVENRFNKRLLHEMYQSLNEFYDDLGLDHIRLGDDIGWTTDFNLLELKYTTKLARGVEPCLVLEYNVKPRKL